jgi:hypothetical protein
MNAPTIDAYDVVVIRGGQRVSTARCPSPDPGVRGHT